MLDLLRSAADLEQAATAGCPMKRPSGHLCGAETVISVLVGCVHEHLRVVSTCQYCVEVLALGGVACVPCRQVDGHFCEVVVLKEVSTQNDPEQPGTVLDTSGRSRTMPERRPGIPTRRFP